MNFVGKLKWKTIISMLVLLLVIVLAVNSFTSLIEETVKPRADEITYDISKRDVLKNTARFVDKCVTYKNGDTTITELIQKRYHYSEVIGRILGDMELVGIVSYEQWLKSLDGTKVFVSTIEPDTIIYKYFPVPRQESYRDLVYIEDGAVFAEIDFVSAIRWGFVFIIIIWVVAIIVIVVGLLKTPKIMRASIVIGIVTVDFVLSILIYLFFFDDVVIGLFAYMQYAFIPVFFLSVFGYRKRERIYEFLKKETGLYHKIKESEFEKTDYIIYGVGSYGRGILDIRDYANMEIIVGKEQKIMVERYLTNQCLVIRVNNEGGYWTFGLFNKNTGALILPEYFDEIKLLKDGRYLAEMYYNKLGSYDSYLYYYIKIEADGSRKDQNYYNSRDE